MTTRVDPEQYRDTPIFRELLRDRKGRWPGIPMEELSGVPFRPFTPRTAPAPVSTYDPEETAPMLIPHVVGD